MEVYTQPPLNLHSQLTSLKNSLNTWEDFILKTNKFYGSLKMTIANFAAFLDAFQKVADIAYNCECGLKDVGTGLTRFRLRQRDVESKLRDFNVRLSDSLAAPLSLRLEEWKRTANQMEKDYSKESRRYKQEIQRASLEADKWSKRVKRKDSLNHVGGLSIPSSMLNVLESGGKLLNSAFGHDSSFSFSTSLNGDMNSHGGNNFAQHDLTQKQRALADWERVQLRKAVVEERRRFMEFLTCLKPVLDTQMELFRDVSQFKDGIVAIYSCVESPEELSEEVNRVIQLGGGSQHHHHQQQQQQFNSNSGSSITAVDSLLDGASDSPSTSSFGGGEEVFFPPTPGVCSASSIYNSAFNGKYDSISLNSYEQRVSSNSSEPTSTVKSPQMPDGMPLPPPAMNGSPYKKACAYEPALEPTPPPAPISHPPPPALPKRTSASSLVAEPKMVQQPAEDESTEDDLDGTTDDGGLSSDEDNNNNKQQQQANASIDRLKTRRTTVGEIAGGLALYPDQALPPPAYGNISRLEKEATGRKFSLVGMECQEISSTNNHMNHHHQQQQQHRPTLPGDAGDKAQTMSSTQNAAASFASVMGVPRIRDMHSEYASSATAMASLRAGPNNSMTQQLLNSNCVGGQIYARQQSAGGQIAPADTYSLKSDSSEYAASSGGLCGAREQNTSGYHGSGNTNSSSYSPAHSMHEVVVVDEVVGYARTGIGMATADSQEVNYADGMSTFRRRHSTTAHLQANNNNNNSNCLEEHVQVKAPQKPSDLKRQYNNNNNNNVMMSSQTPGTPRRQSAASNHGMDGVMQQHPRRSSSVSRDLAFGLRQQQRDNSHGMYARAPAMRQQQQQQQLLDDQQMAIYGGVKVLPSSAIHAAIRARQRSVEPNAEYHKMLPGQHPPAPGPPAYMESSAACSRSRTNIPEYVERCPPRI